MTNTLVKRTTMIVADAARSRRFYEDTPFLPGSRRGFLRGVAEQPIPMAIGIAVTAVLRYFHANLFA